MLSELIKILRNSLISKYLLQSNSLQVISLYMVHISCIMCPRDLP